ncbi:hypothetical protein RB195_019850 [Necator americanus]|uniref:Sodium:neurotransmitter symporter family protein n=1 Tax=Necator americanus TaxID=51031 RepID=A0ABR1CI09_NECAM
MGELPFSRSGHVELICWRRLQTASLAPPSHLIAGVWPDRRAGYKDVMKHSKLEGSEREFANADTVAMSPNMKTPPYDSAKLENVEHELGAPRNVVATKSGINWFLVHCVLCPKLLCSMHFRLIRNGGVFFFIPLLLSTCLIVVPLSFMELALGQYTSKQATIMFPRMSPILSGVGYTMFAMRIALAVGLKTEHRLCSLIWELIGTTFFERRNVECLTPSSSDCYIPNVCRTHEVFHQGACYDLRNDNTFTTDATILLRTQKVLESYIYSDDYNLPIASDQRVFGKMPGCHRVDGVLMFFTVCLICSRFGVSSFSKFSASIVLFSFFAVIIAFISLLLSGYYRISVKFLVLLNNDPSYLLSLDTWIEAIYLSLLLLSIADGSLHSLGASCSFGNNIIRNITHSIYFNTIFVFVCSLLFGMTTCVGLELKYRQHRKIDAPTHAIRNMLEKYIDNQDFSTPLYYFAVSNPFTKAATAVLVMAFTLLSSAVHVLAAEDVVMMVFHFCPSLLKLNSSIVRHCILSIMFITLSVVYYNLTHLEGIEKSYVPVFMATCVLAVWECICVSWNYTTFRLLVNIRVS